MDDATQRVHGFCVACEECGHVTDYEVECSNATALQLVEEERNALYAQLDKSAVRGRHE